MSRIKNSIRAALLGALLMPATLIVSGVVVAENSAIPVTVYKTPTCGCCQAWVEYLQDSDSGFEVTVHDLDSLEQIKTELGLTDRRLHSCHTAKIGDYVVEGHVPVMDIQRLLQEKPPVLGLTAPGMPMLSPGMNSIDPKDYDVLSFDRDGNIEIYSSY